MKMKIAISLMMLCCSGCSTIMCGPEKTINIQSTPAGARFEITTPSGQAVAQGTTPNRVTLKRGGGWFKKANYTICLKKEGYKPFAMGIRQDYETGWYAFGNFVFGGLVGLLVVDPLTGSMWTIEDVDVRLERIREKTIRQSLNK